MQTYNNVSMVIQFFIAKKVSKKFNYNLEDNNKSININLF